MAETLPAADPTEAAARRDAGALIVDVREPDEFDDGHVPGAELIPLGEIEDRRGEIPRDRDVILICGSGKRSAKAQQLLADHDIRTTNLTGGITAWKKAGLPTTS